MMRGSGKLLGGILLISGTTIGAGMLALPTTMGLAGFIPSLYLFGFYWAFMTFTAFLLLEVNLWMDEHTNLVTMARKTLGAPGEVICWVFYLFLLYALTTAYIAGSGPIVSDLLYTLFRWHIPEWMGMVPLIILFSFFVYRGTRYVDRLNRLLMLGLVGTFLLMVGILTPYVKANLLEREAWNYLPLAVSVVATSFGFHIIIPSLTTYFHRDVKKLRKALLIGSLIPLIVYVVWQFVALGIVPYEGEHGIETGFREGANGVRLITFALQKQRFVAVAECFSFFAIVTSFLGVSLSLSDFLADGLKIRETPGGRVVLCLLTFVPPILFTMTDPRAFLRALEYAGAYGVVILLALLPAAMCWSGRYIKGFESTFKVWGGKLSLVLVGLISTFVILIEMMRQAGYIQL